MNLVQGDHRIDEFSRQGTRGRENQQNRSMPLPNSPNTTSADFQAILSGRNAMRKTLPWQVLIKGKNICGGTLVSAKHVISAAHCFQDHDKTYAYGVISAGHISRTRSSLSAEPERQERNFGKYIPHRFFFQILFSDFNFFKVVQSIDKLKRHLHYRHRSSISI